MDDFIRVAIDKFIDEIINNSAKYHKDISMSLRTQGIEPNLETILSYIVGCVSGTCVATYRSTHPYCSTDSLTTSEQDEQTSVSMEFVELMKRRATELRQAFIATHTARP